MLINWKNINNMQMMKTRVEIIEIQVKACIKIVQQNSVSLMKSIIEREATVKNNSEIK